MKDNIKMVFAVGLTILLILGSISLSIHFIKADEEDKESSLFTEIERTFDYYIVYNNDTKVMYAVSDGSYNHGTFTLLVNPDGTPMIYEE